MFEPERLMLVAPPLMTRSPAFERATALALAKGAALHIVAFDYLDGLASAGLFFDELALKHARESYLMLHRQWLEKQADSIRHQGVRVTTQVVWAPRPHEEIMVHVREIKPSMVIKDLEHLSWLTRALFTPLDVRLLHDCPAPLHLVSKVAHALPRKILAAVDPFSPDEHFAKVNDTIITGAERLAAQCGAQLHLLYAYDLSYIYASEGLMDFSSSLAQTLYETEEHAFDQLTDRFGVQQACKHLLMGNPAKVIKDFAQSEGIDVIVMGTVHRDRLNALLGSTTEQVAHHLPSSLLTLNPRIYER